jgi:antitoxin HigA-1
MTPKTLVPVSPGEILLEEFLKPMGISQNKLGLWLRVPPQRINDIVKGKRPITLDTALRLSEFFGNTAEFWLRLQMEHDLRTARRQNRPQLISQEMGALRAGDVAKDCVA